MKLIMYLYSNVFFFHFAVFSYNVLFCRSMPLYSLFKSSHQIHGILSLVFLDCSVTSWRCEQGTIEHVDQTWIYMRNLEQVQSEMYKSLNWKILTILSCTNKQCLYRFYFKENFKKTCCVKESELFYATKCITEGF